MSEQDYDLSKITKIEQTTDRSKANSLLDTGWVLLKVTESQFHDTYGALKADVVFTLGNPQ
jgi:G:T-mismatch repair DNA endonuclease (very short patch repair protein)